MTQPFTSDPFITVCQADYGLPAHADALVGLLDSYARDPAGGGKGLDPQVKAGLVAALAARPYVFSVLAWDAGEPVGLVNCVEGFSTFACRPLVNIHDVAVLPSHRGRRVAVLMLALVVKIAQERGACKLTLEVLQGNNSALQLYQREGFAAYQLDPAMGQAIFLQKLLD